MTRLLRILASLTGLLGFLLALPGIFGVLLLLGAAQISCLAVGREQEDHEAHLYPADLAPDSEPR